MEKKVAPSRSPGSGCRWSKSRSSGNRPDEVKMIQIDTGFIMVYHAMPKPKLAKEMQQRQAAEASEQAAAAEQVRFVDEALQFRNGSMLCTVHTICTLYPQHSHFCIQLPCLP